MLKDYYEYCQTHNLTAHSEQLLYELYKVENPMLPKAKDINEVVAHCCQRLNITPDDLKKKCRQRHYVYCKMVTAWMLLQVPCITLERIGAVVGQDHVVILYYKRKVNEMIEVKDKSFMPYYQWVCGDGR